MNRKKIHIFIAIIAISFALSGCACKHEWQEATCITPKTCALCALTEGEPLGHKADKPVLTEDYVKAESFSVTKCSICKLELESSSSKIEKLHDGKVFHPSMAEIAKRYENLAGEIGGTKLKVETNPEAEGSYAMIYQLLGNEEATPAAIYKFNGNTVYDTYGAVKTAKNFGFKAVRGDNLPGCSDFKKLSVSEQEEMLKEALGEYMACHVELDNNVGRHMAIDKVHVAFELKMGKWHVISQSKSGVWVNDVKLVENSPKALETGDIIDVANRYRVRFM